MDSPRCTILVHLVIFFYRKAREAAIEKLELAAGAYVADIFCGTGVDFSLLASKVGEDGGVLAVDGSAGMLERARARAQNHHLNANVELLRADFSEEGGIKAVEDAIGRWQLRHVFLSLGLTCLENWREFCSRIFDASPPKTRLSIMDVYKDHLTLGARFINWIGAADCRRPVWRVLEERCASFSLHEFRPFKVLDVSVIVASGTKA